MGFSNQQTIYVGAPLFHTGRSDSWPLLSFCAEKPSEACAQGLEIALAGEKGDYDVHYPARGQRGLEMGQSPRQIPEWWLKWCVFLREIWLEDVRNDWNRDFLDMNYYGISITVSANFTTKSWPMSNVNIPCTNHTVKCPTKMGVKQQKKTCSFLKYSKTLSTFTLNWLKIEHTVCLRTSEQAYIEFVPASGSITNQGRSSDGLQTLTCLATKLKPQTMQT